MPLTQVESGIELSDRTTRYGQALNTAEKLALDARTGKRIIYLISDFQKNGYAAEEQDFHLGEGIELQTIDVGSDDFSNLAIRDVIVTRGGAGRFRRIHYQRLPSPISEIRIARMWRSAM